jgi:uroporphyrinogen decarboxylase
MTSRQRLLAALDRKVPDRLPVTTHHLMPWFLEHQMGGISEREFFDRFGLDAIFWTTPLQADESCPEDEERKPRNEGAGHVDRWRVEREIVPDPHYETTRYRIATGRGTLSTILQNDGRTSWVAERLIKKKADAEIVAEIATAPLCDVDEVNRQAAAFGERGIVRGAVPGFPIYGQPGCWQDAAVLYGIEALILETFSDPGWVEELLTILQRRKLSFLHSARGACFDLLELGGGDASSSVISPAIFDRFVAPFDAPLVAAAHESGLRVVYHTCGGMMPLLERIAGMGPDAMETFTPRTMGGDVDLREAKRRIGHRVCMIGGFDQFHDFVGCSPEQTRLAVRRLFEAAGQNGGYVLSPSDHFFEADEALLHAFAEEAHACLYSVSPS